MNRGHLLAFEGIDGAGKTTQANALANLLACLGIDALVTKEPTEGKFGSLIRSCSRAGRSVSAEQELEWFVRDREEHVEDVIKPALRRGVTVICDRYYLSTVAYQGARNLDPNAILADSEKRFPVPEIAFWLDIEPDKGLGRVRHRGNGFDPVYEDIARLKRASEIFRCINRPYVIQIDAEPSEEDVTAEVAKHLARLSDFKRVGEIAS